MKKEHSSKSPQYYNSIAQGYNELHGEEQLKKYHIIADCLRLPSEASVLDVGAGTGIGNTHIAQMIGIDPASELISQHPNKLSIVGSAEALPYPDSSFDAVLSVSAIHHTDVPVAVKEMLRVSREWIVITVLKKSPRAHAIGSEIERMLKIEAIIDENKDTMYFAKKNVTSTRHEKHKRISSTGAS